MICPECGNDMQQASQDYFLCLACGCNAEQLNIFMGATMMHYALNIEPMGAVRMTNRGKFVKGNAQRYLSYKKQIAWQLSAQHKGQPITTACRVNIIFCMPIPASYSKKKKAELPGRPHDKKPDIDNLIKGAFDAANGIIWADDNRVIEVKALKVYAEQPGIILEVTEDL